MRPAENRRRSRRSRLLPAWPTLLAAALLAACAAPAGRAPGRLALVIGNAAYENAPALKNPAHDASDMCAALARLGFVTLCRTDLRDRAAFEAAVRDYLERLGPDSAGVVYYSGHGVQADGSNFLIPTRVSPRSAAEDPLGVLYGLDELIAGLGGKRPRFQLVILDACRTDLFPRAPAAAGAGATRGVGAVPARTPLLRALETVSNASSGLARIQHAPPGTVVLYATASREAAYDGRGRNGPLTRHVLDNIGTPGLLVGDFIQRVIAGVENETTTTYGQRQTPYQYGSFSGRFCFAGCPGEAPPPPMF